MGIFSQFVHILFHNFASKDRLAGRTLTQRKGWGNINGTKLGMNNFEITVLYT